MEKNRLESIVDDRTENDIIVYTGGTAEYGFGGTPIIDTKTDMIIGFHWGIKKDYKIGIKAKTVVDAILKQLEEC